VRTATQNQNAYKRAFTKVIKQAIDVAIDHGRLPWETFAPIDIQCEAPSIQARDEATEAQANQIRVQGGWKSRQTVQQEEGLDPEQEMRNIEEYDERFRRGGQGDKSGPVPVHEADFNPDEPRNPHGEWTRGGGGIDRNDPSKLEDLPPPGGVIDPAVIARCRREAERIAAEDEERVARGKEPKNDFVREILATNPNISSDDLKRELFGMLLEEDARKRHAHRLKNDPAYVQGIKDVQASQRQAERQLAIQKMSGGERLVEALERSISSGNLSSEMREQVKEMIAALKDPRNQAILGSVLATVGIAQFTPAGPVVDSIVGILGYILVGKAVLDAAPDLARFETMALEAKDDSDFDQAGQYFARGISPLLVQAGTTLVGMGVAKATSAGAKLVGKRIAALKVSKNPITSEGGKLRVDPAVIANAEAEGATAAAAGNPPTAQAKGSPGATKPPASPVEPVPANSRIQADHTYPTGQRRGSPVGRRTLNRANASSANKRGIELENWSADRLAESGYNVEQNPSIPGSKKPDFVIEGRVFDNYAPSTSNARSIVDGVNTKVREGQADRIVLNLADSNVTRFDLRQALAHYASTKLTEIILIEKTGKVSKFYP